MSPDRGFPVGGGGSVDEHGGVDGQGLESIDFLLGEGSPSELRAFRAALQLDVDAAADLAETGLVVDAMRELGADLQPSGRVTARLRGAARERLDLRGSHQVSWGDRVAVALRVAAVALVWFGVSWATFGAGLRSLGLLGGGEAVTVVGELTASRPVPAAGPRVDYERDRLLHDEVLPVDAVSFIGAYAELAGQRPENFAGRMEAENLLARLRREAFLRQTPETRAALRRATGTPDLEARADRVATVVAARLRACLQEPDDADPVAVAYGLRGLLAAGSTPHTGAHADAIVAAAELLTATVARDSALAADRRAVVLAALADLAVVEGAGVAAVVADAAERLAREVLRAQEDRSRPPLLRWSAPVDRLAEACRVLRLAPAFGCDVGLADRARRMVAAHLQERIDVEPDLERPRLLVAQLYGCGDLVDRREVDRRLRLWRARHLLPDQVAVQQLAWSRYPVRSGWSEFQLELRGLSGRPTPDDLLGAGAFLLTLCTNVAAPGLSDSLGGPLLSSL